MSCASPPGSHIGLPGGRSTLRIGIDATAVPVERTGAGNYIFNLVRALARVDRRNEYVVFAQPAFADQLGATPPNVRLDLRTFGSRGQRLLWEQAGLPGVVARAGLDLLHSPHYTMPLRLRTRSVVTFCDMTFVLYPELHQPVKRVFFPAIMRWSARRADRLIAISESTGADLSRLWGVPRGRIATIPLAADPEFRMPAQPEIAATVAKYGLRPRGYALYVGVLEPRKSVHRLVEAFAAVASRVPDIDLVIAGKRGWMYDAIFAQVERSGLVERVKFIGFVPQEELPALYAGARVFAYPSRYEGFGLPVLEAMSCGTPVVTSNVSSMPEVAGDGALLVHPDDTAGLADALLRVIQDEALSAELVQRGRVQADRFSWERCARETIEVYHDVVGAAHA
jgi:glycosyltransferase involved in cell wall biosynthesis